MTEPARVDEPWWLLDFYNDRDRLMTRVRVQARLPARAADIGRQKLLVTHPADGRRRRESLFSRAQSSDAQPEGWALYRIAREA